MYRFVGVVMLCFVTNFALGQCSWQFKKEDDGIKIYTGRAPNTNFKAIKVECTVNARLSQLVAFLLDVSGQNEWVYGNKSSELVKKIGTNEIVFYSVVDLPWPCANRDYISHIIFTQESPQALSIEAHTEPDLLPEKSGLVRIRESHAHWDISSVDKEHQSIVYTVQFDPGGSLPAWLVNMFVTKGPLQTFQKLRVCVAKPQYKNAQVDFIKE